MADSRAADARRRVHGTLPSRRELLAKLGRPELGHKFSEPARKAPKNGIEQAPGDNRNASQADSVADGTASLFSLDSAGEKITGRSATSFAEARKAAEEFVGKPIENEHGLVPATVSNKTLAKMPSSSAVEKSTSPLDHLRAVANVDAPYRIGMLDESYGDKRGEPTIAALHRVVAPMVGENGEVLVVKMTVKETTGANHPNPLHAVETLDVEKPALLAPQGGIEPTPGQNRHIGQAGFR